MDVKTLVNYVLEGASFAICHLSSGYAVLEISKLNVAGCIAQAETDAPQLVQNKKLVIPPYVETKGNAKSAISSWRKELLRMDQRHDVGSCK